MNYDIVSNKDRFILSRVVNERMKEGWIPLGGISTCYDDVSNSGERVIYTQAMVTKSYFDEHIKGT